MTRSLHRACAVLTALVVIASAAQDAGTPPTEAELEQGHREHYAQLADAGVYLLRGAVSCAPVGDAPCAAVGEELDGPLWGLTPERMKITGLTLRQCENDALVRKYELDHMEPVDPPSRGDWVVWFGLGTAVGVGAAVIFFLVPKQETK